MSPITGRRSSTVVVVRPTGRLEGEGSQRFQDVLAAMSAVDEADLVVDLAAVPTLDDASASALVAAQGEICRRHGTLTLEHVRGEPRGHLAAVAS